MGLLEEVARQRARGSARPSTGTRPAAGASPSTNSTRGSPDAGSGRTRSAAAVGARAASWRRRRPARSPGPAMAVVADRDGQVGVGRGRAAVDASRRRSAGRWSIPLASGHEVKTSVPAWVTWSTVGSSKPSRRRAGRGRPARGCRWPARWRSSPRRSPRGPPRGRPRRRVRRRGERRARTSRPAPRRTPRRSGRPVDDSVISCTTPCRTKPIGTTWPSALELGRRARCTRGRRRGRRRASRSSRRRPRPPRPGLALPQPVSTRPERATAHAVRRTASDGSCSRVTPRRLVRLPGLARLGRVDDGVDHAPGPFKQGDPVDRPAPDHGGLRARHQDRARPAP